MPRNTRKMFEKMSSVGEHMPNRCGRVALLGPPNAGKSTLLNTLLGQKVTIVTPKPQTTRNQIVGILSDSHAQAIFMDTPGLTQVRGHLSKTMIQAIWESLRQADVIMPVLDGNLYVRHGELLEKDLAPIADVLREDSRPMIVVVNKIDLFGDKSLMLPLFSQLQKMWPNAEFFPASALLKDGVEELRKLIVNALPLGEALYPEDQLSPMPVRFMAEKLFLHLRQEVPYSVAVDIESWDFCEKTSQTVIGAVIYVAKPMHKAMVIGKQGATIKEIGTEARKDINELIEGRVHLDLWVKVREHWTEDVGFLRDIGLLQEDV